MLRDPIATYIPSTAPLKVPEFKENKTCKFTNEQQSPQEKTQRKDHSPTQSTSNRHSYEGRQVRLNAAFNDLSIGLERIATARSMKAPGI
jgi:hypothetical protein